MAQNKNLRIGIYAGVFNPVHAGHISFALQAAERASLDKVYFLPERRPAHKSGVEHFGHRVAMLRRACRPHPKFAVLELEDVSFTVDRTVERLRRRFPESELVFLFGSDAVQSIANWPNAERLIRRHEFVIAVRGHDKKAVQQMINNWPDQPPKLHIFSSYSPEVSSGSVRQALSRRQYVRGLLASVASYSNQNWLYVSLAQKDLVI